MKINVIKKGDKNYPFKLFNSTTSPDTLYYAGDISIANENSIAVIGKRNTSQRDQEAAKKIGKYLSEKGYVIINGLAIGCDKSAVEGALESGGKVIAIMPGGLDDIYPASCKTLAEKIINNGGCLISEYAEGVRPAKHQFIERDRIQAQLADIVCVISAEMKGGTMHTVGFALKESRPVVCFIDKDKTAEGNKYLVDTNLCTPFTTGTELLQAIKTT